MGIISIKIKVRNSYTESEWVEVDAKVDTGATLLVLPGRVADQLNLRKGRKVNVKYANETTATKDVVWGVEMELCGRVGVFEAIVEPDKEYALIGAVVLESLDLVIEPAVLGIYPNPRSLELPMAEIEEELIIDKDFSIFAPLKKNRLR